ncbi:hypothetical protein G6O69_09155 [Pseudenhygromyxa sp. WMMC2535]|uniref:hypothetical protein n=1 Tax=Pseudenhygromyxa sp. WMMC2535 TaxID=2712867 RepID=UPI001557D5A0|nr:hypothetical protein [Pseudenhygromyxa sp. WMMC2535]NVB37998.1 hypothetical protein [Pseudenhygromyxa sp. WMMC2535]
MRVDTATPASLSLLSPFSPPLAWACAAALFVALLSASSPAEAAEVCDLDGLCVDGGEWRSGEQLDDKQRSRKRNRKRKDVSVSLSLSGEGRASVFVDGVWIALAPVDALALKPGKHDVEVRDGERVLARGVLTVPRRGEVRVTVPTAPPT